MKTGLRITALTAGLALFGQALAAQQPAPAPAPPPPPPTPLAVGVDAPDFTLPAATMAGVGAQPLRLSDLRDKTVVIAFFFRARTRG
ncbi:MAG: redoxin domain-containing protein [Gemmatimonadales bacterium]|nr:redoxin domain-containing protein [Gemmatimonadales bacterium]